MAQGIDAAVLARRQKDVENFIDQYQQRLDGMVGDRLKEMAPAWQRMTKQLQARVTELYKELGALEDPTKIRALYERAGRLENLAAQLADDLTRLEATYQPYYTGNLLNQFEDSYYFHAYGLEQAARVSIQAPLLTKSTVLGVLANPWLPDGANYSSRLRANTAQLAGKVRGVVANAAMQGWSINEAARQLQAVTNEGFYNAARIMRTELNRAASLGSSYLYMENADVLDGKRWNATLDSRTAPKDAANDGNTYDLDYDTPGNPAIPGQRIPNHPHCRCKYSPILSALGVSTKERIARETGDSAQKFGGRTYTEARTYEEYAQEKGFPLPADRKDYAKSYLRPGETVADINKNVVRWQTSGGTISVPKADWDVEKAPQPKPEVPKAPLTGWQPAATLKEAATFAMQFADAVDYSKIDLDVANLVNKTLYDNYQANPLPAKFNFIGELKDVNKRMGNVTKKRTVENAFMEVKATTDVQTGEIDAYFAINKTNAGTLKLIDDYIGKLEAQGLIKGANASELVTHEYGHLLELYNPVSRWTTIANDLYDEYTALRQDRYGFDDKIREKIGRYILTNKSEFFAEAYRLYTYDKVPTELNFINSFFEKKGIKRLEIEKAAATIQQGYQDAKNVKEAAAWAMDNLGIDLVDYKGFDIRLANSVNKTLEKLNKDFPEGSSGVKWLGTNQERNRLYVQRKLAEEGLDDKATWVEKKYQSYMDILRKQVASEDDIDDARKLHFKAQAARDYDVTLKTYKKIFQPKRSAASNWATATNETWGPQAGISYNDVWAKDFDKFSNSVSSNVRTKFHPEGTEDPASIFTHEYGHQLDYFLMKADKDLRRYVITDVRDEFFRTHGSIREAVSEYATKSDKEFFAECFAEYIHNPNPRPTAAEVGRRLEEALKKIRERGATE